MTRATTTKQTQADQLRAQLQQTINDAATLNEKRRELVQQIAELMAIWSVGDVIIGDKGKPAKIERIVGREDYWFKDGEMPTVSVKYLARLFLKNGSPGKNAIEVDQYTLGKNIRLATPNEIPKATAKPKKERPLRAPGLDDGESPFHPVPGLSSAGEY